MAATHDARAARLTATSGMDFDRIEAELAHFEAAERTRLGLPAAGAGRWVDRNPRAFERAEREHTTLLFGGLTRAQDLFIQAALAGLGYRVLALETPDNDALRLGKEFGNRGQCNPTYFTVGNLIKYLTQLRDVQQLNTEQIVQRHVFITAGACGPCRFGMYATEYRKALRDAGFEGFRVLLFQQQGGLRQASGEGSGLELGPRFFLAVLRAMLAGDLLNLLSYRIRPYEQVPGGTDASLAACRDIVQTALRGRRSLVPALWRCRSILRRVAVDRLQPKPKVSIIGEFWAMTTEGDGNYRLQRFLESEGAEVDIQPVTAWLLYLIWQVRWDTRRRMRLPHADTGRHGLAGRSPRLRLAKMWVADKLLRGVFHGGARLAGLRQYALPNLDEVAAIAHPLYDNHLRGGEGHMEVGKFALTAQHRKAHMVVSVKPFGCMPSSGVSDGVQSLVAARNPQAIFAAIETTGDGAVNAQSRLQMDLFRARRAAVEEFDAALKDAGISFELAQQRCGPAGRDALFYPRVAGLAGTAARVLRERGFEPGVLNPRAHGLFRHRAGRSRKP